jgi:archaellum biogenesis ATPase FlaH
MNKTIKNGEMVKEVTNSTKMKPTKVIFIDSFNKRITYETIKDEKDYYRLIFGSEKVQSLESYPITQSEKFVIDERGIYFPERGCFNFLGLNYSIFGNCIIEGYRINDYKMTSVDTIFTLEEVNLRTTFLSLKDSLLISKERREESFKVTFFH